MTCIVGCANGKNVWMGGDSASVDGWTGRITNLPKVFIRGKFLIGYTSSFRMGQILQHKLDIAPQNGKADDSYMACDFIDAVRKCLKDNGYAKVENNVEQGGTFLVGYNGKLYRVGNDFQVNQHGDIDAVGIGDSFALGAMRALGKLPCQKRIEKSLEIAAYFSMGVMPPFLILKI